VPRPTTGAGEREKDREGKEERERERVISSERKRKRASELFSREKEIERQR
jgi:hypothetical protein